MPNKPTAAYMTYNPGMTGNVAANPPAAAAPKPAPVAMVDVVSYLDALARKGGNQLDWKVSIVDLLKLLGMDSSGKAINDLAIELGCPEFEMGDSARRNIWLHKTVLAKIAENGGNIPANLLHK
jgi:hypothetical protein